MSAIESLIYKFNDMCGESPTEMGDAARKELHALNEKVKELEAYLHLVEDGRFCDNDGRGCGSASNVYYFFHPEEKDWVDCGCGKDSIPFINFPAICSVCGGKR